MTKAMEEASHITQQHLQKLEQLCRAVNRALELRDFDSEQIAEVWRAAISAECTKCGTQVSGEELLGLSQALPQELPDSRLGRLRLGDCALYGCDSYYYRLTFRPHPSLNWPDVLVQAEDLRDYSGEPKPRTRLGVIVWKSLLNSSSVRRIALALVILLLLLLLRQWYIGGRIPLLREPEVFQIAPESIPSNGPQ